MSVDAASVERQATRIEYATRGTPFQRESEHFLNFLDLNRGFLACLADKGFHVDINANFHPLYQGWTANPTSGRWLGALRRGPSTAALAGAESNQSAEGPPDPGSMEATAAYQEAATACSQVGTPTQIDDGSGPYEPANSNELSSEFYELLESVDEQLGSIEPYNDCMNEAGIKLDNQRDGYMALWETLSNSLGAPPLPDQDTSEDWDEYLDFEDKALDADEECRADTYRQGLVLLAPLLSDFEMTHSQDLADLAEQWEQTAARAVAAGMPQIPGLPREPIS